VLVIVTGDQGRIYIDVGAGFDEQQADVGTVLEQGGAGILRGGRGAGVLAQLLSLLQAAASQIRQELLELQTNQIADSRASSLKHFMVVNGNLQRINLQPEV
jgi:hypothetical protein